MHAEVKSTPADAGVDKRPNALEMTALVIASVTFVAYWFSVLVMLSPQNTITQSLNKPVVPIRIVVDQAWYFFSPPPHTNIRLYYTFYPNDAKSAPIKLEVFQDVHKSLFDVWNIKPYVIDNLVHGACADVSSMIKQHRRMMQAKKMMTPAAQAPTTPDSGLDPLNLKVCDNQNRGIRDLANYALELAASNSLSKDGYRGQFEVAYVPMPTYDKRVELMGGTHPVEYDFFKSEVFSLKKYH